MPLRGATKHTDCVHQAICRAVYHDPATARPLLWPLIQELEAHCVGSLREILDGDPPHTPRGCIAQAWTVAEVLRAWSRFTAHTFWSSGLEPTRQNGICPIGRGSMHRAAGDAAAVANRPSQFARCRALHYTRPGTPVRNLARPRPGRCRGLPACLIPRPSRPPPNSRRAVAEPAPQQSGGGRQAVRGEWHE